MSRICPTCGTANDTRAAFCGACATQLISTSTALVPVRKRAGLPALNQKEMATLGSVALGLAAVAVRVGLKLLQHAAPPSESTPERAPAAELAHPTAPAAARGSVRIRRRWMVGDGYGPIRWGEEEYEIEDDRERPGPFRITLR